MIAVSKLTPQTQVPTSQPPLRWPSQLKVLHPSSRPGHMPWDHPSTSSPATNLLALFNIHTEPDHFCSGPYSSLQTSVRQASRYSFAHSLSVAFSLTWNQRQTPCKVGKALRDLPPISFLTSAPSSDTPGSVGPDPRVCCSFGPGLPSHPQVAPGLTLHSVPFSAQMSTREALLASPSDPP